MTPGPGANACHATPAVTGRQPGGSEQRSEGPPPAISCGAADRIIPITPADGARRWRSRVMSASCSTPPATCTCPRRGPMAHHGTGWSGSGSRTTTSWCAPLTRSGRPKICAATPGVVPSVTDLANPYRMATIQGRVIQVGPDEGCRHPDPISVKYTGAPFPSPRPVPGLLRDGRGEGSLPHSRLRSVHPARRKDSWVMASSMARWNVG